MKQCKVLNAFFLSNPLYRGMAEKAILVGTGICGLVFSWNTWEVFPFSNIAGGVLALLGYVFHHRAEKNHIQAHTVSDEISTVVTSGIYSKIRHPLYLSLIVMNIGIALAFGVVVTFGLALLTIVHWGLTASAEEKALMERFPDAYRQYTQQVRWLLIPGIF